MEYQECPELLVETRAIDIIRHKDPKLLSKRMLISVIKEHETALSHTKDELLRTQKTLESLRITHDNALQAAKTTEGELQHWKQRAQASEQDACHITPKSTSAIKHMFKRRDPSKCICGQVELSDLAKWEKVEQHSKDPVHQQALIEFYLNDESDKFDQCDRCDMVRVL